MTYALPFPKSKVPKGGDFGNHEAPRTNPHRGVDFAIAGGTPIPSATDGKVVVDGWTDVLGHVIVIEDEKGTFWGYCHMREASKLNLTDVVKCGDIVGKVGNTGSASRGAHLHFTCGYERDSYKQGKVVDPIATLEKRIAKDKAAAPTAPVKESVPSEPKEPAKAAEAPKEEPAVPAKKPALKGELKKGSKGEAVNYLQASFGFKPTGVFGDKTHEAVVKLQKDGGLKADGIVGPLTWKLVK
jgi:peptidoglycan hydrolase-like protein with peptidoglycan-binding domain